MSRWSRMSGGRAMYADSEEHVALVLRTLGLDEARWSQMLDRYCELWAPQASVEQRLGALAVAFASVAPHAAEPPDAAASKCIVCGAVAVEPVVAKRASKAPLVYGRCHDCGHGIRLAGPTIEGIYDGDAYYRQRSVDGTGYDAYQAERSYREAKGARLVAALETSLGVSPASSLLEVGSGFGYTLAAAAGRGWRCQGIDVNPEAARAAKQLYGFETRACTLEQALATGSVATGAWEVVLYHFVLEHVADPLSELLTAARALRPGGSLVLVVPSMSTFELDVFGASYRSLRADHLHLFSARSIGQLLQAAGLELSSLQSHCSLHLARGFLNQTELDDLYASGRGPDFTVLAQRKKS